MVLEFLLIAFMFLAPGYAFASVDKRLKAGEVLCVAALISINFSRINETARKYGAAIMSSPTPTCG